MPADPAARVASGSRVHAYPMQQRAATLWYHDHTMAATAQNVWRGLFGMHLVHDDEEDALGLPSGDRDLPVAICDRSFGADGSLLYPPVTLEHGGMAMVPPEFQDGVLGDVTLVNGVPWPVLEAPAVRHRLRLLNASNARAYRLALWPPPAGGGGLVQIGSDGGLLEAPVAHDAIDLSPGERYDVVVDLGRYQPGAVVDLVNELEPGMRAVMRFRVGQRLPDDSRVPERLSTVERLDPGAAVIRRSFDFRTRGQRGPWTINAGTFDPGRVDAAPTLGAVEVWSFTSDVAHPVHVHLDPFQVVSRGSPGRRSPQDVGLEGHRRGTPVGDRRGGGPVHRLRRPVRRPLPQPRARGHGDDGQRRHPLTHRGVGRTATGGYAPGLPGHTRPSCRVAGRPTVSCR